MTVDDKGSGACLQRKRTGSGSQPLKGAVFRRVPHSCLKHALRYFSLIVMRSRCALCIDQGEILFTNGVGSGLQKIGTVGCKQWQRCRGEQ